MIIQLDPWVSLDTPDGPAYALFYEVQGDGLDAQWHCVLRRTRQFMTYRNSKVLMSLNITMGIGVNTASLHEVLAQER